MTGEEVKRYGLKYFFGNQIIVKPYPAIIKATYFAYMRSVLLLRCIVAQIFDAYWENDD